MLKKSRSSEGQGHLILRSNEEKSISCQLSILSLRVWTPDYFTFNTSATPASRRFKRRTVGNSFWLHSVGGYYEVVVTIHNTELYFSISMKSLNP